MSTTVPLHAYAPFSSNLSDFCPYMKGFDKLLVKRGDIFCVELTIGIGSEQTGCRPMLIIQNNVGNKHSRTVIAAVITGKIKNKPKLPTHYLIKSQQGLKRDSLVLLEQIRTIDKTRLREYIGTLDNKIMSKIDNALAISVGLKL